MKTIKPKTSSTEGNGVIQNLTAELYFQCRSILGEGPVWEKGTLYWIDITGKMIFAKPDHATSIEQYDVGSEIGAFALWQENQLILATERGFQSLNLKSREIQPWIDPESALPNNRFNDGKCDPKGRFVAGTLNRGGAPEGALYILDHDKTVRELYRPVTCSNGLAWSENGKIFYYIDTPTRCVRAFDYDLDYGRLSNERVVIEIPKTHGYPDGMSIDRKGHLWIALWDGWGVECWDPTTGKQLARIEVPAALVTSCTFGGDDYETLFITTARQGLESAALAKQELAGSIFRAQPGVGGHPAVHFQSCND